MPPKVKFYLFPHFTMFTFEGEEETTPAAPEAPVETPEAPAA